ncbi:conserved hypothetical protein, partial [Ricinus communis]
MGLGAFQRVSEPDGGAVVPHGGQSRLQPGTEPLLPGPPRRARAPSRRRKEPARTSQPGVSPLPRGSRHGGRQPRRRCIALAGRQRCAGTFDRAGHDDASRQRRPRRCAVCLEPASVGAGRRPQDHRSGQPGGAGGVRRRLAERARRTDARHAGTAGRLQTLRQCRDDAPRQTLRFAQSHAEKPGRADPPALSDPQAGAAAAAGGTGRAAQRSIRAAPADADGHRTQAAGRADRRPHA